MSCRLSLIESGISVVPRSCARCGLGPCANRVQASPAPPLIVPDFKPHAVAVASWDAGELREILLNQEGDAL